MANYKRRRPRTQAGRRGHVHWLNDPSWFTLLFDTRPQRRITKRIERDIVNGADYDEAVWPLPHKPRTYYW